MSSQGSSTLNEESWFAQGEGNLGRERQPANACQATRSRTIVTII